MQTLPYPPLSANITATIVLSTTFDAQDGTYASGTAITCSVRFDEHTKWVRDKDGKLIESAGRAYVFGDIFKDISDAMHPTGYITIKGNTYTFTGSRFYNPDGTCHHIRLELT